jgi:hypothetical protein
MNLNETESPLVTPVFSGTDEEKVSCLSYWAELIAIIRSLNSCITAHENKLAIINQLKTEVQIIDSELNNLTAKPQVNNDGSVEMKQETEVDLSSTDMFAPPKLSVPAQLQKLAGINSKTR